MEAICANLGVPSVSTHSLLPILAIGLVDLHVEKHVAIGVSQVIARALVVIGHHLQAPDVKDGLQILDQLGALWPRNRRRHPGRIWLPGVKGLCLPAGAECGCEGASAYTGSRRCPCRSTKTLKARHCDGMGSWECGSEGHTERWGGFSTFYLPVTESRLVGSTGSLFPWSNCYLTTDDSGSALLSVLDWKQNDRACTHPPLPASGNRLQETKR